MGCRRWKRRAGQEATGREMDDRWGREANPESQVGTDGANEGSNGGARCNDRKMGAGSNTAYKESCREIKIVPMHCNTSSRWEINWIQ